MYSIENLHILENGLGINDSNPLPVKKISVPQAFIFQNAAIASGQGNLLTVGGYTTLTVEIYGTGITARKVNFYAINKKGESIPIMGYNISTATLANSTTSIASEIWQFDVTGLNQISMSITSFAGTNTTISGTAVI